MRVSVVMPVYNREAYVAEAIDSVLGQSRPPEEFIAVDDGSFDATPAILDRYEGHIVRRRQPNQGQTAAINHGVAAAGGDLLAFIDADDIWERDKLARQLAVLEARADIDAVFGLVRQFVSPDVPVERRYALTPRNEVVIGESRVAMLIRRAAFDKIGDFDRSFQIASFVEWLGRAKRAGLRRHTLDRIVARRRLHPTNGGLTATAHQDAETLLALKRVIEARR
jgi:glycosyltransferase involved in cell wall biosynthesis